MREIKYRQRIKTSNDQDFWHYWGSVRRGQFVAPISNHLNDPRDSQQWTGMRDKTGVDIYEDDYIKYTDDGLLMMCRVYWQDAFCGFSFPIGAVDIVVTGNTTSEKNV